MLINRSNRHVLSDTSALGRYEFNLKKYGDFIDNQNGSTPPSLLRHPLLVLKCIYKGKFIYLSDARRVKIK